jgi:hypothetical protein
MGLPEYQVIGTAPTVLFTNRGEPVVRGTLSASCRVDNDQRIFGVSSGVPVINP